MLSIGAPLSPPPSPHPPLSRFYWYETALQASDHIGAAERFNWQMFLSLLAAWILIYLCLFKGIQSSGKVIKVCHTKELVVGPRKCTIWACNNCPLY